MALQPVGLAVPRSTLHLSSVCFVIEVQAPTPLRVRAFGRVDRLFCPLLTSDGSATPSDARVASSATRRQTSAGKSSHLPTYARRIYFRASRQGTDLIYCALSSNAAPPMPFLFLASGMTSLLQIPPHDDQHCLQTCVPLPGS